MKSQLVLDGDYLDVVERPEMALLVEAELRNQEQRDATRSGRSIGSTSQNEMDDVVGQIVITERDEYLCALDGPGAVAARHGLRT
jgi:hypothetical protein